VPFYLLFDSLINIYINFQEKKFVGKYFYDFEILKKLDIFINDGGVGTISNKLPNFR